MKTKGQASMSTIAIAIIIVGALIGGAIYLTGQADAGSTANLFQQLQEGGTFATYEVDFQTRALGNGAQDDEDDVNIEIYEWDEEEAQDLIDQHIVDCTGAIPALFDGDHTTVVIAEENYCSLNVYDALETWTAGDWEGEIGDYLVLAHDDVGDKGADDSPAGGTGDIELKSDKVYLITIGESADADEDDVIPIAFLLASDGTTTFEREKIEDGTIDTEISVEYYSDAVANSKLTLSGECTDNNDRETTLSSAWNGVGNSYYTSAATLDWECTLEIEVNEDGYALITDNPLASSSSEYGSVTMTPYGEENGVNATWQEYGADNLTGDVPYSVANVQTDQIIWEESTLCSKTITDNSGSDAVKLGDEKIKLRELGDGCMTGAEQNGLIGVFDNDGAVRLKVYIENVRFEYDNSTSAQDEALTANSGSSGEAIADIDCLSPAGSTTDFCAQTLNV